VNAPPRGYRAVWQKLGRKLMRPRAARTRAAAWSLPDMLPALGSGLLIAHALDDGFLARRPWVGVGLVAALGVLLIGRAVATRMSVPWLCVPIEPLRSLSGRRTRMMSAVEVTAQEAGAVLTGLRDVIACGAHGRATADVGAAIAAQARATRAVAWADSVRIAVVALGYCVPLVGLPLTAPWLTGHGWLSTGDVIGAAIYLVGSVQPALAPLPTWVYRSPDIPRPAPTQPKPPR
jgi:hypothetical protein